MPFLLWVCRDSHLQMTINGQPATTESYLNSMLQKQPSRQEHARNGETYETSTHYLPPGKAQPSHVTAFRASLRGWRHC